jgi:hypothetical protein
MSTQFSHQADQTPAASFAALDRIDPLNPPVQLAPLRLSANVELLRGLLVQLLAMSTTALLIFSLVPQLHASIRLLIAALVLLTLRHVGGLLVLLCLLLHLLLTEPQVRGRLAAENSLAFCLACLVFLMFLWRQRPLLQEAGGRSLGAGLRTLSGGSPDRAADEQEGGVAELSTDSSDGEPVRLQDLLQAEFWSANAERLLQWQTAAIRGVLLLLFAVAAGCVTVALLPRGRSLTTQFREVVQAEPEMQSAALLITVVIAVMVVATELARRRMSAGEARQLTRSQQLDLWYDDLWQIVRRRIVARQKRFARRPIPGDTALADAADDTGRTVAQKLP